MVIVATALVVITGRPGSPNDPLGAALGDVQRGGVGARLALDSQVVAQQVAASNAFSVTSPPQMSALFQRCVQSAAGGTGILPLNYVTIVNFLIAHGYPSIVAAGIAGNIHQESGGDPEVGDAAAGGLIGWTPLPGGYITGDPAADLQTQLQALLVFNDNLAEFLPALDATTTPADAAYIYMLYFERPSFPAAASRQASAIAVAAACGFKT